MSKLRLKQHSGPDGRHRVEVELSGIDGQAAISAVSEFSFALTENDQADLRWYLEDYLQNPHEPAPTIARRIEGRIAELGTELFKAVFHSSDDARDLWAQLRSRLHETRVEISASVRDVTAIPWELLCDTKTESTFALHAPAFVRTQHGAARNVRLPNLPAGEDEPIRTLLVICRPGGRNDVPFRSVASRLIKGLTAETRQRYQLDVLRPPSFARLGEVLHQAREAGRPYHVVHFDGHGAYLETPDGPKVAEWLRSRGMILLGAPRAGSHGYLCFENANADHNVELVGGTDLGDLLYQTQTPVLVLNACQSAYAEPLQKPEAVGGDAHRQVRAFGSLAQEVIDQGVAGVVAMRYSVYVVTAAQFVADLYAALARGRSLGEAVTHGRKQLAARPERSIAYKPIPLQDWSVPVVFEAAPIQLFPPVAEDDGKLRITVSEGGSERADTGGIDRALPAAPDAGFFGRDETLLTLDRAFDRDNVVLLHAYAGSGKTATAAEFARWYHQTGGLGGGPVLFTSFEHYAPLRNVLGHFGQVFGPLLEAAGVNWSALIETDQMCDVALQVLQQVPVLWIWDNVEPIHGFPRGNESDWSTEEQDELRDFLRAVRGGKVRILLTSRRDEDDWLGELPRRVAVPPMPMTERVQLARALVERRGRKFTAVADWRPLLAFTQGNPLTITVLVGQALREGMATAEQIERFVERLQAGEADFADEQSEGRSKSLGASLRYGFDAAFSDAERCRLALLHPFQGFVDVVVLHLMGHPKADWRLPEIEGVTRESWIELLDRAADVGLVEVRGGGYYSIHPALPWFFRSLFDTYFPSPTAGEAQAAGAALRAFVEAMGELGSYYHRQNQNGNCDVVDSLAAEEANLLHARRLARTIGWHGCIIRTMQGLQALYEHTGRRVEWKRLVEEIVPDFVNPATDGPLRGPEEEWAVATQYRVRLAREAHDWPEAERLQRLCVEWIRRLASPFLERSRGPLDDAARYTVRTLGVSLHEAGQIQCERGEAQCVTHFRESFEIAERIADEPLAAVAAFSLGQAYVGDYVSALRNLDQAETWYRRSLELHDETDHFGRARCLGQLGVVAFERVKDVSAMEPPAEEVLRLVNEAVCFDHQALDLLPENAADDRAAVENHLGVIYGLARHFNRALNHYRESIRLVESTGNAFNAARARSNVAIALARAGRFADAREYALAALRNYETFGHRAAAEIEKTKGVLAFIDKSEREQP